MEENLKYQIILNFKESVKGNFVDTKYEHWINNIFNNEYSPFKIWLETVEPGKKIKLIISVEILNDST